MLELWLVRNLEIHVRFFKGSEVVPTPCHYVFSITNFIVDNQQMSLKKSFVHSINTRNNYHHHRQFANF